MLSSAKGTTFCHRRETANVMWTQALIYSNPAFHVKRRSHEFQTRAVFFNIILIYIFKDFCMGEMIKTFLITNFKVLS